MSKDMNLSIALAHLRAMRRETQSAMRGIERRINMVRQEGVIDDLDRAYIERLEARYERLTTEVTALTVVTEHIDPSENEGEPE